MWKLGNEAALVLHSSLNKVALWSGTQVKRDIVGSMAYYVVGSQHAYPGSLNLKRPLIHCQNRLSRANISSSVHFFFTFCINSFIFISEMSRQGGTAQVFWTACSALNLWTKQSCEWKLLKLLDGTQCPKKEKTTYFLCLCVYEYFKDPRDKAV